MPICPKCGDENPQLGARCPRDGRYYIHDWAIRQAEADDRLGTIAFEKYVIVSRISKGGMGAVYRALQLPIGREIALKVLAGRAGGQRAGRRSIPRGGSRDRAAEAPEHHHDV